MYINLSSSLHSSLIQHSSHSPLRTPLRYRHIFIPPPSPALKSTTQLSIFLLSLLGCVAMTSIFQRLTRPFTSSTLRFAPDQAAQMSMPEGSQKATIAAGCFWGIEHLYRRDFEKKGLLDARVGYIGGTTQNPTYREVCGGDTMRMYLPTLCALTEKKDCTNTNITQMPKPAR